jgi:hypothetical protein
MNKKNLLVFSVLVMSLFMLMPLGQANAAAGTTGTVDGPANVKKGVGFWFKLESLTNSGEYILVPSVATMGITNITFTANGADMRLGPYKFSATGSVTFSLYGATGGAATGSALDTYDAVVNTIGTGIIDTSAVTDLIAFFLPIIIVVTLVLAFKFRDKIKDLR